MSINILTDAQNSLEQITLFFDRNKVDYRLYNSIGKLEHALKYDHISPLMIPYSMLNLAYELANRSYLVIIDNEYNAEHILNSLRSGAANYYSLDEKAGKLNGLIDQFNDNSNKRLQIWLNEQRFRTVLDHTHHSEFLLDTNGKLLYQSPSIERMTGYPISKFLANSPDFFHSIIHPDDRDGFLEEDKKFQHEPSNHTLTKRFRIITQAGDIRWWESTIEHIFDSNSDYLGARGTSRDIHEQVMTEQKAERVIEEKDLLIMEVHHRVKNNLAVLSSILNLQELYLHDERDTFILDILKNRIDSMLAVHELLYSGRSTDTFNLEDLARKISMNLIQNTDYCETRIDIDFNINPTLLRSELASPLGLILNELITNCMKYAFAGRTEGRIFIGSTLQNNMRNLYIEDDGHGFPDDVLSGEKQNLGLVLTESLAVQLGGTLYLNNRGGAQAIITFPVAAEKKDL